MSTTPQAQPTAVVPNEMTPEQIAEQLASQAAPATQPATNEPPSIERDFSVVLDSGQVYKGRTKDEVIDQLKKAQENATRRIKELSDLQKQPITPATVPTVQTPAEPQFDNNKYYQLLAESPIAAQSYALQFTPEAQELRRQTEELRNFQQGMQTQATVNAFKAETPDLPIDDASVAKFEETWDKFRLPITKENLKLVHAYCLQNKVYDPYNPAPASNLTQSQPLPTLNGGGGNVQTQPVNVNAMTPEQIEELIQSLNGQK